MGVFLCIGKEIQTGVFTKSSGFTGVDFLMNDWLLFPATSSRKQQGYFRINMCM